MSDSSLGSIKGHVSILQNGVRELLEARIADYSADDDLWAEIQIDKDHSYWWVLEYGSGEFFAEDGRPDGSLSAPPDRPFPPKRRPRLNRAMLAAKRAASTSNPKPTTSDIRKVYSKEVHRKRGG